MRRVLVRAGAGAGAGAGSRQSCARRRLRNADANNAARTKGSRRTWTLRPSNTSCEGRRAAGEAADVMCGYARASAVCRLSYCIRWFRQSAVQHARSCAAATATNRVVSSALYGGCEGSGARPARRLWRGARGGRVGVGDAIAQGWCSCCNVSCRMGAWRRGPRVGLRDRSSPGSPRKDDPIQRSMGVAAVALRRRRRIWGVDVVFSVVWAVKRLAGSSKKAYGAGGVVAEVQLWWRKRAVREDR